MSGFNPFGLSALGSMSTLGNLAQSAQRLDRFNDLMSSRPRNQNNSGWDRDKRRSLDDDFFGGGGMMGGGGSNRNRRSLSPPRHFDHDDRRNQRRDRSNQRRSRGNDNFGSSSGAGILGAAPSLNDGPSSSLSALGDLGGFAGSSWNEPGGNSGRGVSQLNTQTQQLLNMMQTQQLLAAVQAQASLANTGPPSLMQTQTNPGFSRQGGRNMNPRNNPGRYNNRNDRPRNLGTRFRDDRKRRMSPPRNPIAKRDRRDNTNREQTRPDKKDQGKKPAQNRSQTDKESSKRDSKKESKGTGSIDEKEKKQEVKEKEKVVKNAAGEDVEALVSANFDGKRYWCSLCKIVCLKSKNIYKHFLSKRHVKAAVEKEGKVFDPEIMKEQESDSKTDSKPQDVTKLLKYVCNSRKIARKENNDVYISSQTECTVKISDFTTKQDFMGSEFVKSISGFKCQLCKVFLRTGNDVLHHIQGKRHKGNYEAYLKDHPSYPDTQFQVNKNLVEILEKEEGKDVLLFEIKNDEPVDGVQKADQPEENCNLEDNLDEDGVSYNMDDFDPTDDAKPGDDSNVAESSQDESALDQSGMSDATPAKAEETEEEVEKSLLNEDEEEQENDGEEEVQVREDELLMTPSEEEIPFLEVPAAPNTKKESKETKTEKPEETEGKEDQEDGMEDTKNVPTSDVSFTEEAEEEPEVAPAGRRATRRGRSRGRGATKATRGKNTRKTTRGAKNVKKKTEEVPENVEEPSQEMEEEPSTETKEEPAKEEEEAPKEKEEAPKDPNEDMMGFIDGFEVIDEFVGEEEEEDDDDD